MPLMLLMIFGIIDFGRALQQQIQLTEAVREGARLGVLNGTVATMQAKVNTVAGTTLTFTTTTPCSSSSAAGSDATVTAYRTYAPVSPIFAVMKAFGSTVTGFKITATGVMGCLG
ncbi:pilus assembly protein [Actinoplanes sp. TBRC 11911]|nr:pilus assembly protein [Actinoplanes sp. TBRC 11911]